MANYPQAVGRNSPYVESLPKPIIAQRAPATTDTNYVIGQSWVDQSVSPNVLYFHIGGGDWNSNELTLSTDSTFAAASDSTASSSLAIKTYVDGVAIAGAPDASEVTKGIAQLATQAEAETGTNDTDITTPLKVTQLLASGNHPVSVTTLTGSGAVDIDTTGAISLDADAASNFSVAGAGIDLTLASAAGRVVVNGEEAADDAVRLLSAAGGLDADFALSVNIASSETNADSVVLSSGGGIDLTATGGAGLDIDLANTSGSVNISSGENVADAITLSATAGGIDIVATGAAGEDLDLTCTNGSVIVSAGEAVANAISLQASAGGVDVDGAGQVNIASSQNAGDAIRLNASAGGIDIDAAGAAGEDITIDNAAGSITLTAGEAAADALGLQSSGGIDADCALQMNLASSQAAANAIRIVASDAAGGIDIDDGGGGIAIDGVGAISIDSAAASNFSVSGAGIDLTLASAAGRVIVNGEEAAANAITLLSAAGGIDADCALQMNLASSQAAVADSIRINASAADGGIDIDAGTGGIAIDTTGAFQLSGANASNVTVTAAGQDLTIESTLGRVIVNAEEAAANAITLLSAAGGIDADCALQMNLASSQNAADAIRLNASAGGIDIDAAGAAGEDIDIANAAGSVNLSAGEADSAAISLQASAGGVDIDGALQVNIASSQASTGAVTLAVSNASGSITHTGRCVFTPDSITSDNAGVAASVSTLLTLITTDGDSNEDNVTLADGQAGQVKIFSVIAAGNAADSVKITPANMAGGTKITFAADPTGLGCMMVFDGTNWTVAANNGGTIA